MSSKLATKIMTQECILRFKNGSPKLKDVLRKRCKERWKNDRENLVDRLRNITGDEEVQNTLTNIIREDLKVIYAPPQVIFSDDARLDMELEESAELESDLLDENFQWLMKKYEEIFGDENQLAIMEEELNEVICPICQKSPLQAAPSTCGISISCQCGLSVTSTSDLLQIKESIMACVDDHSGLCSQTPQFSIIKEHDGNHIYLICYACSNMLMLF